MSELNDYLHESLRLDQAMARVAEDNEELVLALEAAGLEIDHLKTALANRLIIGQAQGLLMERLGLDSDQALGYLKRASMHLNRKVIDIAREIMRTRTLPRF